MRKRLIITGGILSVSILICVGYLYFTKDVYNLARNWLTAETHGGSNYFLREIGTNIDLWLNGYLGIFFRFKKFGVFNWLAFPLFFYFLNKLRKRKRWEIALWLVLSTSCVFICLQGYANYRYQLTLYPILITIIFLFGWQVLKKQRKIIISAVIAICCCILLVNCYSLRKNYQYYFKAAIGSGEPGEGFPYKLIEHIKDNVADEAEIWERNQPILYYHTNKKTLPYYGSKKVKYLLIRGNISERLKKIGCDLVFEDQGYKLYKVKKKSDTLTKGYFDNKTPDFETNFSNWMGKDEIPINNLPTTIFPMENLGVQGEFTFKRIPSDDGNIVRVMLKEPWFNKRPEIQFGYWIQPERLNLRVESGELVSIIARMRLNGENPAELFVQDKTDYWSRENVFWSGSSWSDVLVSKKIREGFAKICLGINWKPRSTEEWLDIKLVRIYHEKKNK